MGCHLDGQMARLWERLLVVLENWIFLVRNGLSNNIWADTLNKNDSSIFWLPLRLGVALWQQVGSD